MNDWKDIVKALGKVNADIERNKRYLAECEARIESGDFDSFSSRLIAKADRDCLRSHLANLVSKKMEIENKLLENLIHLVEKGTGK